jgi:hypothetical protein
MSSQIDEPANLRPTNSASIDWSRLKPRCFDHGCTGKARGFEHDAEKSAAFPTGSSFKFGDLGASVVLNCADSAPVAEAFAACTGDLSRVRGKV